MFTLQRIIHRAKKESTPSKDFSARLWQRLDAELPAETRREHVMSYARKTAIGFAIMIPMLSVGTSVYAYSSPSVTEGTVLYPVKQSLEKVQLRFVQSPEARAEFHTTMLERRIQEAEILSASTTVDENAEITLTAAEKEYTHSTEAIGGEIQKAVEENPKPNLRRARAIERLKVLHDRYSALRSRVPHRP